ncbi:MAG TPA: thioredoxin family protein [Planctomycetota bacterium]|nr:thioredoxin family protein [Planctomycetota bacterium]
MSSVTPRRSLPAIALFLLSVAVPLEAQEQASVQAKESPPPVRRFFDRPIDYWQHGMSYEDEKKSVMSPAANKPGPVPKQNPSEWGQLVKQADGTMAYHELPRPLIEVLEDPSPEKIRAYFEWKLARTQKILRAAEAMKDYKAAQSEGPPPAAMPAAAPPAGVAPAEPAPARKAASPAQVASPGKVSFTVTYFHRSGCPHCDTQDAILGRWLKDKPEAKLIVVDFGEKPELWQRFRVRGTPSLVLEAGGSSNPVFLEGVSQESELGQALLESSKPAVKLPARDGGEKK